MFRPDTRIFTLLSSTLLMALLALLGCSDSSSIPEDPPVRACTDPPVVHTGVASYYDWADGGGNCMFDPIPNDLMVVALNTADYAGALSCGSCIKVTGPKGEIIVRVVDRCPGCLKGDIDLSPYAFSLIADLPLGRVPIRWQLVPCEVTGPISYHFKQGSNQWWTAVQIRNHRYPILSFEYITSGGSFKPVERMQYNYFVEPQGMGQGPYTFRVKDIYGQTLLDSGIVFIENGSVAGKKQFPSCNQNIFDHTHLKKDAGNL